MRTRKAALLVMAVIVGIALLWTWSDAQVPDEAPGPPVTTPVAPLPPQIPAAVPPGVVTQLISHLTAHLTPFREAAARRLTEIGLPALPVLRRHLRVHDCDAQERATVQELIAEIERGPRSQRPIVVDGAEFQVVAEQTWKVPRPGGRTSLLVGLRITNVGRKALVITLAELGSVSAMLMAANGDPVAVEPLHAKGTPRDARLVHLGPGEDTLYQFSEAKLEWGKPGTGLRLLLAGPGGGAAFVGLSPRTYYLRLHYRDVRVIVPADGGPTGLGDLYTDAVEVELR